MTVATTPLTESPLHGSDTATQTRLEGKTLLIARIAWVVIFAVSVWMAVRAFPNMWHVEAEQYFGNPTLEGLGVPWRVMAIFRTTLEVTTALAFTLTALLIFRRRSDDWMALFTSVMLVTFGNAVVAQTAFMQPPMGYGLHLLPPLMTAIGHASFVIYLYIVPDGKFVPRWTIPASILWSGWMLISHLAPASPISIYTLSPLANFLSFLIAYISGLVAQNWREKHHLSASQRQQIKWITIGLIIALIGGYIFGYLPTMVITRMSDPGSGQIIHAFLGGLISTLSLMAIPLTIAFSILRYRLWDVDLVLNRSVVYGALTVFLVVAFALDILILQRLARLVTGGDQAPVAIALSAVVVGAVFQPVRKWMQNQVDKHLFGIGLNYQTPRSAADSLQLAVKGLEGTNIGPYRIDGLIGRGGMAEVYRGYHSSLGRDVAVKVLPARMATEADFRARFEREARTVAALRHSNIVQVFDFGEVEGLYYMVMEYLGGRDLGSRIREGGALPFDEACTLISDIADALDYAHGEGLVHRDIKPSNVMLQPVTDTGGSRSHRAVLTDFGITKIAGGETGLTNTGVMGSFDYIAPEQIRDTKEVDFRADIYGLGVMAYQMVTGELPFTANNPGALLMAHLQRPAPDPRLIAPDLPAPAAYAIMCALAKEPDHRQPSAGVFAAALRETEDA